MFYTHKRMVYFRPHTLIINTIACEYLHFKSELAELSKEQKRDQLIIQTATILHNEMKNEKKVKT